MGAGSRPRLSGCGLRCPVAPVPSLRLSSLRSIAFSRPLQLSRLCVHAREMLMNFAMASAGPHLSSKRDGGLRSQALDGPVGPEQHVLLQSDAHGSGSRVTGELEGPESAAAECVAGAPRQVLARAHAHAPAKPQPRVRHGDEAGSYLGADEVRVAG